nr:protein argonaute 10-like isoform X3 [Physcomitrium patens]|eukprot:XP_024403750.1 protein argonaute 10-like isoform X3 [Physcomitrella patens]
MFLCLFGWIFASDGRIQLSVSPNCDRFSISHGSKGEDTPSIAAVVATKNWPDIFHYATRAQTQPATMEMIEGLHIEGKGGMVKDLLLEYHRTCRGPMCKPNQIIVYRNRVSECQFAEVLEKEVIAFKRACRDIEPDYNPGITFIVAQKRHNTRFFPQGRDTLRNGNVMPGTVVDKDICHPHNYDFFLGTSRPTHYHVLVNENKLGPDDIQSLTNNLCYTFGRCSTSISMGKFPLENSFHILGPLV